MDTLQSQVREFHEKYGCAISDKPTMPDAATLFLRGRFIIEESAEFIAAAQRADMVEMCDALADLLYVVYGAAVTMGVDMGPIFEEVHRSNMTKLGVSRDGKVAKGPRLSPPRVQCEIVRQGYEF